MNRPVNNPNGTAANSRDVASSEHATRSSRQHTRRPSQSARHRLADDRAPWRVQMQVAGTILLSLVVMAVVALFYLNVSTKTAALGRLIQFYTVRLDGPHRVSMDDPEGTIIPIEEIDIEIAGLRARLAELTSLERIERRSQELGFKPLNADSIVYVQVAGYQPREPIRLAPEPFAQVATVGTILPAYQTTLIDEIGQSWSSLVNSVMAAVIQSEGGQP